MNASIRKSILFATRSPHMNFEFAIGAQICVGVKNPIMVLGITVIGIEAAMVLEYVRVQSGLGLFLLHSLSLDLICISRFYL
jgi:hypothetical protein